MAVQTYTATTFDLDKALAGTLVTFEDSVAATDINTKTGLLYRAGSGYRANINGVVNNITSDGYEIVSGYSRRKLKLISITMATTYGTSQTMTTRGDAPEGQEDPGTITSIEPRDQFAIAALQALMGNIDQPQSVNDSTIILYSRAAYRWAQGMMIAAADSRDFQESATEETTEETEPTTTE